MTALGFCLVLLGALNGFSSALAATWSVDRDLSWVDFSVKQLFFVHVRGTFNEVRGRVVMDEQDIRKSQVSVSIIAESLTAERAGLTEFLKGPELFHTDKFFNIRFHSKKVKQDPGGWLTVLGNLTIRGVSREVELDVQRPNRAVRCGGHSECLSFRGLARINRKEFGMVWSPVLDRGGMLVSEDVVIRIYLELIQPTVHTDRKRGTGFVFK